MGSRGADPIVDHPFYDLRVHLTKPEGMSAETGGREKPSKCTCVATIGSTYSGDIDFSGPQIVERYRRHLSDRDGNLRIGADVK